MIQEVNNILLFKTNVETDIDRQRIQPVLDAAKDIEKWNLDLHDVDRVLRVVTDSMRPAEIIAVMNETGFDCFELE